MSSLAQDATGNDLTYRVIGAAMAVHNRLGPGYREEVYERALAAELGERGIDARRQFAVTVEYQSEPVAEFYLDLFVEGVLVVEVKAFPHLLTDDELGQVIGYLKAAEAPVGLLFNLGRRRLEWRRVFPGRGGEAPRRTGRDDVRKADRLDRVP